MTLALLRLITNPQIFEQPEAIQRAWQHVEERLSRPLAWISQPTERHREVLGSLLSLRGVRANLAPDADLAALAIEHGLILCTTDGDFARFEGSSAGRTRCAHGRDGQTLSSLSRRLS